MSIALTKAPGKPKKPIRYNPSRKEGLYILYKIKDSGSGFAEIARTLNVHQSNIHKVTYGLRRAARIESEIARLLGKASWNDVVLEARSAVQEKPVEVILNEAYQKSQAQNQAHNEEMEAAKGDDPDGTILRLFEESLAANPKAAKRMSRQMTMRGLV